MEDLLTRVFKNLIDRVSGPMKFRLLLQLLMAYCEKAKVLSI